MANATYVSVVGGKLPRKLPTHTSSGKLMPGLDSPIYTQRTRWPLRGMVAVEGPGSARIGARLLRRRLPDWTRADHRETARVLWALADRAQQRWGQTWNREYARAFGHAPEFDAYRISGIGDDRLPERVKDRLRKLAHVQGPARECAAAHEHCARYYCR